MVLPTYTMFINRKERKGKVYYSLAVCKRVNGKPKNFTVLNIGTIESLYEKLSHVNNETLPLSIKMISNLECGATLALYSITQKLNTAMIVNSHVPKRDQLIDYGSALEILIIKGCIEAGSLDSTGLWFSNSILSHKFNILPDKLNSNNYCNWFIPFKKELMKKSFEDISCNAVKRFKLSTKKIIIDFSNITTYQKNKSEEQLAQRGKPKDFKKHLRQVNYALAVTLDGIPLTYDTYAGNINDPAEFKEFVVQVIKMIESKFDSPIQYIFTFDKGMLGEDCIGLIDGKNINDKKILFVSALRPSMCDKLFADISLEFKAAYQTQKKKTIEVAETKYMIYGKEYPTFVTYCEDKFKEDFGEFIERYSATVFELDDIRETKLNGPHWSDKKKVSARLKKLVSNKFVKGIIDVKVMKKKQKLEMRVKIDELKLQEKINRFGKTVIFTNDEDASKKEIVTRYFREKNTVELCNKYLKNPDFCNIDPLRCSKDQNINIRIGVCCLSLMTGLLLEKKLKKLDKQITIMPAIQQLKQIRQVQTQVNPIKKDFKEITGNTKVGHKYFEFLKLDRYL